MEATASQADTAQMDAAGEERKPREFQPILLNAHAAKDRRSSVLSHMGMNYNLSSFLSFYPMLRFTGYTFEAVFSPANRTLQNTHQNALKKITSGGALTLPEKLSVGIYGKEEPGNNDNNLFDKGKKRGVLGWGLKSDQPVSQPENSTVEAVNEEVKEVSADIKFESGYKTRFNQFESVVFTSLAAKHSYDNYTQLLEGFKLAAGAELGKDPAKVTFGDLRRSNNPMIVSAVDRFMWQTPIRLIGGLAFAKSLWAGIVANSVVITAERTVFYRPIAYDILSKAVNDVQINSLGNEAKGEVVDNLIRVMQAQRFDHRQTLIPREQVEALRPTLELIADDVINKRFGISGMMYIMGGGVLIPENPAQSMENYKHVRDIGVSGVVEEAKLIKERTHAPSTKIWQARLTEQRNSRADGFVAESARRDELLRERRAILARGPLHAAPGSEIDPNARYGGGIQMY